MNKTYKVTNSYILANYRYIYLKFKFSLFTVTNVLIRFHIQSPLLRQPVQFLFHPLFKSNHPMKGYILFFHRPHFLNVPPISHLRVITLKSLQPQL